MDKKTWTIIFLASVLIVLALYFGISYCSNIVYTSGANDGIKYVNNNIVNSVLKDGYLILNVPYQNKTYQVLMTINKTMEVKNG